MLLTAGPHAETSLWACTLLGLLADRDQTVQAGIASVSAPLVWLWFQRGFPLKLEHTIKQFSV